MSTSGCTNALGVRAISTCNSLYTFAVGAGITSRCLITLCVSAIYLLGATASDSFVTFSVITVISVRAIRYCTCEIAFCVVGFTNCSNTCSTAITELVRPVCTSAYAFRVRVLPFSIGTVTLCVSYISLCYGVKTFSMAAVSRSSCPAAFRVRAISRSLAFISFRVRILAACE